MEKMERIRFVSRSGARILLHDFSGCDTEDLLAALEGAAALISAEPEGSHLVLVDATGLQFDMRMVGAAKEYVENGKRYVKAIAIVGLTGLQETMMTYAAASAKGGIGVFRTISEAEVWLLAKTEVA